MKLAYVNKHFSSQKKNYISLMTYFCLLSSFYSLKLNCLLGSLILQIGMYFKFHRNFSFGAGGLSFDCRSYRMKFSACFLD